MKRFIESLFPQKEKQNKPSHELPPEKYLNSLTETDRQHLADLITHIRTFPGKLGGIPVAVTAFGSTTRPESKRFHQPDDIDLRLNNACFTNRGNRETTVNKIVSLLTEYLTERNLPYQFHEQTDSKIMVPAHASSYKWDRETNQHELKKETIMVGYINYDNHDPSFIIQYPDGLPLHISVSGVDALPVTEEIDLERICNCYFTLLYDSAITDPIRF